MIEDGDIGERQLRSRLETLGLRHDREVLLLVGGGTQALRSALNIVDASVAVALRGGRLEALVQGDGGITVLGLNIVNAALVPAFIGWPVLRGVQAGNHYTITLRGEAVAELVPAHFDTSPDKGAAVDDMLAFMKNRKSVASFNLKALINEGRE